MTAPIFMIGSPGERQGIPSPIPLMMNSMAIMAINTGISLRIYIRFFTEITLLNQIALVINGMVPIPKMTIYKLPYIALPPATAPKTAIYTRPQGKKPFKKPTVKKAIRKLNNVEWPIYKEGENITDFINKVESIVFKEFEIWPNLFKKLKFSDFNLKIFRVRAEDSFKNINLFSEHKYPPLNNTTFGRCNFPKSPVFYSSNNALTALMETVRANHSNKRKFCITRWNIVQSNEELIFQHFLGEKLDPENPFRELVEKEKIQLREFFKDKLNDDQKNGLIHLVNFLSNSFINDNTYSVSASLAHRAIFADHKMPTDILMYPSIQTQFRSVNLAIHPNFVDNRMYIQRFYMVELVNYERETGTFNINISKYGIANKSVIDWKSLNPKDELYKQILKEDFGEMMKDDFSFNFQEQDNAQ